MSSEVEVWFIGDRQGVVASLPTALGNLTVRATSWFRTAEAANLRFADCIVQAPGLMGGLSVQSESMKRVTVEEAPVRKRAAKKAPAKRAAKAAEPVVEPDVVDDQPSLFG